ncbi:MAG: hypothetical protein ACK6B2_08340, partial [Planctomycetota bacterium]
MSKVLLIHKCSNMPLTILPTSKTLASLALSFAAFTLVPMQGSLRADDDPKKVLTSPAQERIYADISYLASDDLKGRAAETPGLKIAADFIAKRFGQLGLQTDLFDGQPFQYFEITGNPGASPET